MTDAFNSTKCGLPSIPQIPEVSLQNCIVPVGFLPPPWLSTITVNPLGVTPPPDTTFNIYDFFGFGRVNTAILKDAIGGITEYRNGIATTTVVQARARLRDLQAGEFVYFYRFATGPSGAGLEVFAATQLPALVMGVLTTALQPGALTTPTTCTVMPYTQSNCALQVGQQAITAYNHFTTLEGPAGSVVQFMGLESQGLAHYVIINGPLRASTTSGGGGGNTSSGCCGDCIDPTTLNGDSTHTYNKVYSASPIPTTFGGIDLSAFNIPGDPRVNLIWKSDQIWESPPFQFTCSAGADSYFWRYTTKAGGHNLLQNCDSPRNTATLSLVAVNPPSHCTDLTKQHNNRNALTGSSPYLYTNTTPVRMHCGSTLYLAPDNALPDELSTQLPCQVCVKPSDGWAYNMCGSTTVVIPQRLTFTLEEHLFDCHRSPYDYNTLAPGEVGKTFDLVWDGVRLFGSCVINMLDTQTNVITPVPFALSQNAVGDYHGPTGTKVCDPEIILAGWIPGVLNAWWSEFDISQILNAPAGWSSPCAELYVRSIPGNLAILSAHLNPGTYPSFGWQYLPGAPYFGRIEFGLNYNNTTALRCSLSL